MLGGAVILQDGVIVEFSFPSCLSPRLMDITVSSNFVWHFVLALYPRTSLPRVDVAHPQQVWSMNDTGILGTIPYEVRAPWAGWRELTPNGTWTVFGTPCCDPR